MKEIKVKICPNGFHKNCKHQECSCGTKEKPYKYSCEKCKHENCRISDGGGVSGSYM